jgi:4'-phosphopantetheinyl transferase EntD
MLDKIDITLDGVEIYHKRIAEDITSLIENASKEDLEAIAEVKSDSRRAEILTTRALIRNTFGENVSLSHNADGSPRLIGCDLNISISHCKGIAIVASHPDKKIGVDIERWRNTLLKVKTKFLSQAEMDHYSSAADLLVAWTSKEAIYKAADCPGLDFARDINLPLNNIDNKAIVHIPDGDRQFSLFTTASSEFTLTLAIPC